MIDIPELNITCGTTDCGNGRHAFNNPAITYKKRDRTRKFLDPGVCKGCGKMLVDWPRVHTLDLTDVGHTIEALKLETIRWYFWTRPFNDKSLDAAVSRGRRLLYGDILPKVTKVVGPIGQDRWAFLQVPTKAEKLKSVIQYAQHAVAACCRRCVHTWHGIANDHVLHKRENLYLEHLIKKYLEIRLPESVQDEPIVVAS